MAKKLYTSLDFQKQAALQFVLETVTTDPNGSRTGVAAELVFFDGNIYKCTGGTVWVKVEASSDFTTDINMNNNTIRNIVVDETDESSVANIEFVLDKLAALPKAFVFKGIVATEADLPTASADIEGHVYQVTETESGNTNSEFVCGNTGTVATPVYSWVELGSIMDMSNYYTKDETEDKIEEIVDDKLSTDLPVRFQAVLTLDDETLKEGQVTGYVAGSVKLLGIEMFDAMGNSIIVETSFNSTTLAYTAKAPANTAGETLTVVFSFEGKVSA